MIDYPSSSISNSNYVGRIYIRSVPNGDAKVEQLDAMPCQRRMFAVLGDLGPDRYIANENVPGVAKEDNRQRKLKHKGNSVPKIQDASVAQPIGKGIRSIERSLGNTRDKEKISHCSRGLWHSKSIWEGTPLTWTLNSNGELDDLVMLPITIIRLLIPGLSGKKPSFWNSFWWGKKRRTYYTHILVGGNGRSCWQYIRKNQEDVRDEQIVLNASKMNTYRSHIPKSLRVRPYLYFTNFKIKF